jgi:RNA polymerase sigma-70 factor (ECF subfamily)
MSWQSIFPSSMVMNAATAGSAAATLHGEPDQAAPLAETHMDSEAFAAFYSRAARPLWAYLARVSGDPALADDLMQESFVRFLGVTRPELSLAEGEVAARRYLFRIATNLLRDHWRMPRPTSIDEIAEELCAAADLSGQSDTQVMLGPALAQMRPRDRQLLWLAHAEGYSHHEIAQITGLASASIRLLLFRARRKIAHILKARMTSVPTGPRATAAPSPSLRSQP